MTGVQALEHKYPDKLPLPGQCAKMEFEYIRHGTTSLIGFFDVATGRMEMPYLNSTRTEEDFVEAVKALVRTDPQAPWTFICDGLNTHKSEALVRFVAEACALGVELGKKGKTGILKSMESRADFLHDPSHRIRFVYTPKHSSWMNQIEIWFGIINRKLLKRKSYLSIEEQAYKIELLKRNLFVLVIIFISLIVLSIFLYQWYKRKKNMQLMVARYNLEQSEHELAELKVRQQELELKSVQSALDNSRQEATSFAVFLHSRNELLEKIREMIKQGYKMDQQALIPHLKKVNAFISQYQNGDKTNSTLLMNVEEKNQEFLQRLSERHPNLTQGEKYLATLLRVNLSTKEISMLTGNVPKTINMNRYRLRKSLNLSSEDDLTDYLQNI